MSAFKTMTDVMRERREHYFGGRMALSERLSDDELRRLEALIDEFFPDPRHDDVLERSHA